MRPNTLPAPPPTVSIFIFGLIQLMAPDSDIMDSPFASSQMTTGIGSPFISYLIEISFHSALPPKKLQTVYVLPEKLKTKTGIDYCEDISPWNLVKYILHQAPLSSTDIPVPHFPRNICCKGSGITKTFVNAFILPQIWQLCNDLP
jgi:hypothetical protein